MNARFVQSSARKAGATDPADPVRGPVSGPPGRACCCVANAMVRVVMPPSPGRPHETELLLCGHHYRVSREALAAAHARVDELPGPDGEAAWYHGQRDHAAPAAAVAG